jgi:Eukaryotic protein of unknown function (DUF846)
MQYQHHQQQHQPHDLHFEVHGGGGHNNNNNDDGPSSLRGGVSTGSYDERPLHGEMSHLPDRSVTSNPTTGTTTTGSSSATATGGAGVVVGGMQFLQDQLKQSSHPTVIIFHLLFKGIALFLYTFGGWFVKTAHSSRFILMTVILILLLAADFWVVKNVTGRLLVGLRWWNRVDEDETVWIFESAEGKVINKFDRSVFWTVLYATPLLWSALFVYGVVTLKFNWLLICVIALALTMANVYGYYKCSKEQAVQFQQMMQSGAQQGALAMMRSNMLGVLTGTTSSTSSRNIV